MEAPILEKQEVKMKRNWPMGRTGFDMLCDFYALIDANDERKEIKRLRKKVAAMIAAVAIFIEE